MHRAIRAWGNRNIKELGYAEIEDFLFYQKGEIGFSDRSSKTRANAKSALRDFWHWVVKRRVMHISQIPDFPEVSFELAFRKTIGKETQDRILDEVHRISYHVNPRIWIGIKWLATYFSIRPGELISIKEGQIDLENRLFILHPEDTKEKKPTLVPMIDEDVEILRSLPRSFPNLPFFRHSKGHGGTEPGSTFGPKFLWKWWKRACNNLGIESVDLYGGTRHSTVISLGELFTPEQLKQASMHNTNKAFERYFRVKPEAVRDVYQTGRGRKAKKTNVIDLEIGK
jgi:integrase